MDCNSWRGETAWSIAKFLGVKDSIEYSLGSGQTASNIAGGGGNRIVYRLDNSSETGGHSMDNSYGRGETDYCSRREKQHGL